MTLRSFRLVQTRFLSNAFDGEGARLYGGRWNNPGTSIVYTAQSLALCALELLVHLTSRQVLEDRYHFFALEFPQKISRDVRELYKLPKDWSSDPTPQSARRIGDQWFRERKSAVLAVPSSVIREEWNYLLNPQHPDFSQMTLGKAKPFQFDARLAER